MLCRWYLALMCHLEMQLAAPNKKKFQSKKQTKGAWPPFFALRVNLSSLHFSILKCKDLSWRRKLLAQVIHLWPGALIMGWHERLQTTPPWRGPRELTAHREHPLSTHEEPHSESLLTYVDPLGAPMMKRTCGCCPDLGRRGANGCLGSHWSWTWERKPGK